MTVTTAVPPADDDAPRDPFRDPRGSRDSRHAGTVHSLRHARIRLSSPADLVAATPYLLHFHPADSVVVLAFHDRAYLGLVRGDLPGRPDEAAARGAARTLLDPVTRRGATTVAILGYGPADRVDPVVPAVRDLAGQQGLQVTEALRVDRGRWWSYTCRDPRCCPPAGTPFDAATSEVAAQCAFAGLSVLPSRADLVQRVAPVGGPARAALTRATDRAEGRFRDWRETVPAGNWEDTVRTEGTEVVRAAVARYGTGGVLDDDELAWLAVLLTATPVRDAAWGTISTEQPHLSLWTDVVRRADPSLVVVPACMLASTAWRFGAGALAGLALDRALHTDPDYPLAHLLLAALQQGPPPPDFDDWGTPERERVNTDRLDPSIRLD